MIVQADRVFFSPERFQRFDPLPIGMPFNIDSGMGGSYTLHYAGGQKDLDAGKLVFIYQHPEFKGRRATFTEAEATTQLFTLIPSSPFAFDKPLPIYAIRVATRETSLVRALLDTMQRGRSLNQRYVLCTPHFANVITPYQPGAWVGKPILMRCPLPPQDEAWAKTYAEAIRADAQVAFPGQPPGNVNFAFEALSQADVGRRQQALRMSGAGYLPITGIHNPSLPPQSVTIDPPEQQPPEQQPPTLQP